MTPAQQEYRNAVNQIISDLDRLHRWACARTVAHSLLPSWERLLTALARTLDELNEL